MPCVVQSQYFVACLPDATVYASWLMPERSLGGNYRFDMFPAMPGVVDDSACCLEFLGVQGV